MHGRSPTSNFGGTVPLVPPGLRPCSGPFIYDVHAEGEGQAQEDACGRGEGSPAPCARPHRQLKFESTDVILSSSHAKKLASFFNQNFVFGQKKVEIFLRYKLLI